MSNLQEKLNPIYATLKNNQPVDKVLDKLLSAYESSIKEKGGYDEAKDAAIRATLRNATNHIRDFLNRTDENNQYRNKGAEFPKPSFSQLDKDQLFGNMPFTQSATLHPNRSTPEKMVPFIREYIDLGIAARTGYLEDRETGLKVSFNNQEISEQVDKVLDAKESAKYIQNRMVELTVEMYDSFEIRDRKAKPDHGYPKPTRKMTAEEESKYMLDLTEVNRAALILMSIQKQKVYSSKLVEEQLELSEFENLHRNNMEFFNWVFDQDGKRQNKPKHAQAHAVESEFRQRSFYIMEASQYAAESEKYREDFLEVAEKNLAAFTPEQLERFESQLKSKMKDLEQAGKKFDTEYKEFPAYKKLSQTLKVLEEYKQKREEKIEPYTNGKELESDLRDILEKINDSNDRGEFDNLLDYDGSKSNLIGPEGLFITAHSMGLHVAKMQNRQTSNFYRSAFDITQALLVAKGNELGMGLTPNI